MSALMAHPGGPTLAPRSGLVSRSALSLCALAMVGGALLRSASGAFPAVLRGAGVVAPAWPSAAQLGAIGPAWYYTYAFEGPSIRGYLRVFLVGPAYDEAVVEAVLLAHPGSWWIVGNEPNDPSQDDLSPGAYAALYHRFLTTVARVGADVRVMPAGIANADWGWAQDWRESYRYQYGRYPRVDAWNVHNYVLGPAADPCDAAEFRRRLIAFREWMAGVGEGSKPLVLSEFGVLRSSEGDERRLDACAVSYMQETVAWLRSTPYVQAWAWFSLSTSGEYAGDLLDDQGALTALGRAYATLCGRQER